MEKGKKSKKLEPMGRSSKRVGTKLKDWRAAIWLIQNGAVVPEEAKTSRGYGHQWIYPILPFLAISCILYNDMVAPKHF